MIDMEQLCKENAGLVYRLASRYTAALKRNNATGFEDLIQAGFIGLIGAKRTFSEDKGSWFNWAAFYVRNEMLAACGLRGTKERPELGAASLDEPLSIDGDETLLDTVAGPADVAEDAERAELAQAVRACVDALPPQQRAVLTACDLIGVPIAQWAEAHGMPAHMAQSARRKGYGMLWRNAKMRALREAWLDSVTPWTWTVGISEFHSTGESSVEKIVAWRDRQRWGGGAN